MPLFRQDDRPRTHAPAHASPEPAPLQSPLALGRLLNIDAPEDAVRATSRDLPSRDLVEQWRAAARQAATRGDRWFSCALLPGDAGDGAPARADGRLGEVLTAVEAAGWRLVQLDHVVVPAAPHDRTGPVVQALCLFRSGSAPQGVGWPALG